MVTLPNEQNTDTLALDKESDGPHAYKNAHLSITLHNDEHGDLKLQQDEKIWMLKSISPTYNIYKDKEKKMALEVLYYTIGADKPFVWIINPNDPSLTILMQTEASAKTASYEGEKYSWDYDGNNRKGVLKNSNTSIELYTNY